MPARAPRLLAIVCAIVLVAGVVAAATHTEGSDERIATPAGDGTTTTSSTDPPLSPTLEPSTETTGAPPPDDLADPVPPTPAGPTTSAPQSTTSPPTADQRGTTPGIYVYDISGTANGEDFSGTSTLEVGVVDAEGRQVHVQSAPDGTTTTTYRHADEGTYLESLEIESEQGSFRLHAVRPYLLLPTDAIAGTTTNGTLEGEDLTALVEFTVVEIGTDTSTATLHVDLSGEISGFEVDGTLDSTIVARTADQLALEIDAKSDIVVGGGVFRVRSDSRSELRR